MLSPWETASGKELYFPFPCTQMEVSSFSGEVRTDVRFHACVLFHWNKWFLARKHEVGVLISLDFLYVDAALTNLKLVCSCTCIFHMESSTFSSRLQDYTIMNSFMTAQSWMLQLCVVQAGLIPVKCTAILCVHLYAFSPPSLYTPGRICMNSKAPSTRPNCIYLLNGDDTKITGLC